MLQPIAGAGARRTLRTAAPRMHTVSLEPNERDLVAASGLRYRMSFKSRRVLAAYVVGAAVFTVVGCFLAWTAILSC